MYIGTSDLSYSLGHGGDMNHPSLKEAIAKVIAAGQRNKIAVGLPARSPEQMQEFVKQGITVFQSPADTVLLLNGARAYLDPLGREVSIPSSSPFTDLPASRRTRYFLRLPVPFKAR